MFERQPERTFMFSDEKIRSQFHSREYVWLWNGRNGGGECDVRFTRWIYRRVISQIARYLSRASKLESHYVISHSASCSYTQNHLYFLTIPHVFVAHEPSVRKLILEFFVNRSFIICFSQSFITYSNFTKCRSTELNFLCRNDDYEK